MSIKSENKRKGLRDILRQYPCLFCAAASPHARQSLAQYPHLLLVLGIDRKQTPVAPCPGSRSHRVGEAGCGVVACGLRLERSVLRRRLGWAALLARVFSAELSPCAACGGRLRILAALTDPASIRRLTCLLARLRRGTYSRVCAEGASRILG